MKGRQIECKASWRRVSGAATVQCEAVAYLLRLGTPLHVSSWRFSAVQLTQHLIVRPAFFEPTPLSLDALPHAVALSVVDAHFELEVRASSRGGEAVICLGGVGQEVEEDVVCGEDGEFELCREEHGLG